MKVSEQFKATIKAYLDNRAAIDEQFAATYAKPEKSLDECINYILQQVQKQGYAGYADDEIYGMTVHYYDEDELKDIQPVKCRVVVNHVVELSEEDKAEARRRAIEAYQTKCVHDEEAAARRREIVAEYEGKYREDKGRYLGLMITDGKITIRPLQSVADFVAEGEAMHHCVFDNGNYKRADTLILSARDNDDKRIETIELNLETFNVLQSRGVCNGITQKHDAILGLVNSNMNRIMKLAKT